MKKLSNINSLFGTYTVSEDFSIKFDEGDKATEAFQDYIYRQTGLGRQIKRNMKVEDALKQPGIYIGKRTTKAQELAEDMEKEMEKEFLRQLKRGVSQNEALENAKFYVGLLSKQGFDSLNDDFPTEVDNKIMARYDKKLKQDKDK